MQFVGNLLWFLLIGLWYSIACIISGIVLCLTIIFIPFGKQMFKFATLAAWPFGSVVELDFNSNSIGNILWLIFGGLENAIVDFLVGVILHITIIGIPFGKQFFKLAKLSLAPFGASII